ncbi:hypothetical protein ALC62_15126, partial [Cyphomyrmex costatus]
YKSYSSSPSSSFCLATRPLCSPSLLRVCMCERRKNNGTELASNR